MPATTPVGRGLAHPVEHDLRDLPPRRPCRRARSPRVASKTAPGTAFATPAPTTAQIHTGDHERLREPATSRAIVWMGMTAYPIAPTTLTRRRPVHRLPDPAARGRAARSTSPMRRTRRAATARSATAAPPSSPARSSPTATSRRRWRPARPATSCPAISRRRASPPIRRRLHTGITSNCIACHSAGAGAGPFAGCTTQAACATPPPLAYQPKTPPLAAGGSPTDAVVVDAHPDRRHHLREVPLRFGLLFVRRA